MSTKFKGETFKFVCIQVTSLRKDDAVESISKFLIGS